jgi:peroxiredoxin Q/BCP
VIVNQEFDAMANLAIGDKAPDFALKGSGGSDVRLSALKGRTVVVYFYPKDDTPGCTKEACGFNDALPDFGGIDAEIIGISRDSVASHDKFVRKYGLAFRLASDEDGKACEAYGTWVEKSMYGKTYMGIERATFLIDGAGTVRGIWRKVKVPGHVEAVLAAAKAL